MNGQEHFNINFPLFIPHIINLKLFQFLHITIETSFNKWLLFGDSLTNKEWAYNCYKVHNTCSTGTASMTTSGHIITCSYHQGTQQTECPYSYCQGARKDPELLDHHTDPKQLSLHMGQSLLLTEQGNSFSLWMED